MLRHLKITFAAIALTATAGAAQAATVDLSGGSFDGAAYVAGGFRFDSVNLTSGSGNGNCGAFGGGTCLQFNQNQTTVMTTDPAGGAFDLNSISFVIAGQNGVLNVTDFSVDPLGELLVNVGVGDTINGSTTVTHNDLFTLNFAGAADGVTSIRFDNTGKGNVRIGGIDADIVSAIPLPAALPLLLTGLAGLGFMSRRRAA